MDWAIFKIFHPVAIISFDVADLRWENEKHFPVLKHSDSTFFLFKSTAMDYRALQVVIRGDLEDKL